MKKMKISTKTVMAILLAVVMVSCKKNKDNDGPPVQEPVTISVTDLKAKSTGTTSLKLPAALKISGTVISDAAAKNTESNTIVLQEADGKAGIVVKFNGAADFAMGDIVEINVSNQTLAVVNGEKILSDVPVANAKKIGSGTITARETTAKDIVANANNWDGTLVSLGKGTPSGTGTTFKTLTSYAMDDDNVGLSVLATASFAETIFQPEANGLKGILRVLDGKPVIFIRNVNDLLTSGAKITRYITFDFQNNDLPLETPFSIITNDDLALKFPPASIVNLERGYLLPKEKTPDVVEGHQFNFYFADFNFGFPIRIRNVDPKIKTISITYKISKLEQYKLSNGTSMQTAPLTDKDSLSLDFALFNSEGRQVSPQFAKFTVNKTDMFYTKTYDITESLQTNNYLNTTDFSFNFNFFYLIADVDALVASGKTVPAILVSKIEFGCTD